MGAGIIGLLTFVLLMDTIANAQPPTHARAASSDERRVEFHIPSQPLMGALMVLAHQADVAISFDPEVVGLKKSPELQRTCTVTEALDKLLAGTGLSFKYIDDTTITVKRSVGSAIGLINGTRAARKSGARSVNRSGRDANLDTIVVVTGSRLMESNAADSYAQRIYDRDALEQSGATTLAQFAEVMPENFSSVNPISSLFGNTVGSSQRGNNVFLGSGFNLSGLGPEATLTLLEGDRWVSGGASGTFFDLSLLPMNAVADIVTLTGDASAVYGSDAIAGVVNILLRSGRDGNVSGLRYGATSDGGGGQWLFSQRLGESWSGGNGMIAYQRAEQSPVLSTARSYIPAVNPAIDIVPRQSSSGLLGSLEQELTDGTSVKVHLLYGARDVDDESSWFGFRLRRESPAREYGATVHIDTNLTPEWRVGLYGSYSRLVQSLTTSVPGSLVQNELGDSSLAEFALSANAEPFTFYRRPMKVAFGVGMRKETLTVPTSLYRTTYSLPARNVADTYVETLLPLTDGTRAFLRRLELSLAAREEYYDFVGPTFNPKAALVWSPSAELSLRATFARSLRPPTLDELATIPLYYTVNIPDRASSSGLTDTLVNQSQGLTRLKPERAKTITGGLDYRRDGMLGWAASVSWFRTIFDNRVAAPVVDTPTSDIFTQPELAPYINRSIDPAQVRAIFTSPYFIQDYAGAGPQGVGAMFDDELTNIERTLEEGLETSFRYTSGENSRRISAFVMANYLLRDIYRPTPGSLTVSLVNKVGQPSRLRARSGAVWSRNLWTAAFNVNYTSGFRNTLVLPPRNVHPWTTLDFRLACQLALPAVSIQSAQIAFNVRNILNAAPPQVAVPTVPIGLSLQPVGFDPANASPLGRMISVDLSVSW